MDGTLSRINDVSDIEHGMSNAEEDAPFTDASPSFKGKLDLSRFGFSKNASQSPSRSSSRNVTSSLKSEDNSENQSIARSPMKRRSDSLTKPSSPRKRKKSTGYAPPSTYSHLSPLPDTLVENLICVFIGLNPGLQTAQTGHAYAHPTNHFWHLLWTSGLTPSQCKLPASTTPLLPSLYSLGNTNIVSRPSRNGSELKAAELDAGVEVLEAKMERYRPECVCVVGKSIWESIWRVWKGRRLERGEFRYGWQEERMGRGGEGKGAWMGARVFVATTTSALAAGMRMAEKEEIWKELGEWVRKRRVERMQEVGRDLITKETEESHEVKSESLNTS